MKYQNTYNIIINEIDPVNISKEDVEGIKQIVLKQAEYPINANTAMNAFKFFASKLEIVFQAKRSGFTSPSEHHRSDWVIHLPRFGEFIASPSKFSVFFTIDQVK